MNKFKDIFTNREIIKNIILVVELILIILLGTKCIKLEKIVSEYKEKEQNTIVQQVKLPDIKEIEESYETNTKPQSNNINTENKSNNPVEDYFDEFEKETATSTKEKLKEKFITAVDFVLYDGEINGHKFKDLTDSAKLKITKTLISIDSKIEKRYPNYKNEIKENSKKSYKNIKEKLISLYLDTTVKVCNNVGDDTCNQAKDDFSTMKTSFKFTWENIKALARYGTSSLKDWYKIYKS